MRILIYLSKQTLIRTTFCSTLDATKHCTPKKQDVFIVIDSSRSIGHSNYAQLKRFVSRFVNKLDISQERTHVGILQASDYRKTQYEMKLGEHTDAKEIQNVINEMSYHHGLTSYIGKGLDIAISDNVSVKIAHCCAPPYLYKVCMHSNDSERKRTSMINQLLAIPKIPSISVEKEYPTRSFNENFKHLNQNKRPIFSLKHEDLFT